MDAIQAYIQDSNKKAIYCNLKSKIIEELRSFVLMSESLFYHNYYYRKENIVRDIEYCKKFAFTLKESQSIKQICENILSRRFHLENIIIRPGRENHYKSQKLFNNIIQFCFNERRTKKPYSIFNVEIFN